MLYIDEKYQNELIEYRNIPSNTIVLPNKHYSEVWVTCGDKIFLITKSQYRIYKERPNQELKEKLEKELNLQNHCKKETLWKLAWEYGHSSGDNSIRDYYYEFSELLQ